MIPLLIVIWLLLLSALFSSSELAIMGVPLYKIKRYVHEFPGKAADRLLYMRTKGERTLIAILIGNNLVNVALSMYAARLWDTVLSQFALSGAVWFMIVSVTITFLILFFWEIIPKVFATKYALKFALAVAPIVQGVIYLLYPFVWVLEQIIYWLQALLWGEEEQVSKEDVDIFMEEGKKQGIFSSTESMIIHNLLEFHERQVESVFTHRTEVFALSQEQTLKYAVEKMLATPHSRIPMYKTDKDDIVGLITIREALRLYTRKENHDKPLSAFPFHQIKKVPITASIFDVFMDMKKNWWHFAVVIDEYGGTAGIVTFEDILEDLVGAIRDESDYRDEGEIVKIDAHVVKVKGDVVLRDVVDMLHIPWFKLPEALVEELSEEDTVSYIILQQLKDFAKKGDTIDLWDLHLEVLRTNKTGEKIEKVRVTYTQHIPKKDKE